jgi:hypothetical protein
MFKYVQKSCKNQQQKTSYPHISSQTSSECPNPENHFNYRAIRLLQNKQKNTVNTSHNVKHVFFGGLAYIWCKFRAMPTIWMKHILKYIFWSGEANNKNPWVWNGHRQLIVGEIHLFSCLKIHMLLVKSESSCFRNPLLSRLNTVYHHYSHNQLSWRILDALRLFSKLGSIYPYSFWKNIAPQTRKR